MKRPGTFALKTVLLAVAIGVGAGLLWFPQTEGRAANLDLVSIYADPFILYVYAASLPFFFALYHAFIFLTYIDKNRIFTTEAVASIKKIKYLAYTLIGFQFLAIVFVRFFANGDDPAGPTMLGLIAIFISGVIATGAGIFQKLLQHAVAMKSENDLTV